MSEYAVNSMSARIAWITVVLICLLACVLLLLNGYVGYSAVLVAVGGSAAINLL